MKLYNTLNRKLEEFEPIKPASAGVYSCGPTVYWNQHIGNMYAFVQWDLLVRGLRHLGYQVKWVMNITDVDDKTIKRTVDEYGRKATPKELREYTDKYFNDFKVEDYIIGNTKGKKITGINKESQNKEMVIIVKLSNNYLFIRSNLSQSSIKNFDQILSTFKFTKIDRILIDKYSDSEYGFSSDLPEKMVFQESNSTRSDTLLKF